MSIFDQWNVDPAKNNKTPPYGAPEKGLSFDLISDTFRVIMAAIAEVGKIAASSAGVIGTLGKQNSNAVAITGGTIDNVAITRSVIGWSSASPTNVVDPFTITHASHKISINVLPLQELYNLVHPVGCVRISVFSNASDLKWAGTNSTWGVVSGSGDRFLVTAGAQTLVAQKTGANAPHDQPPLSGDSNAGNPVFNFQGVSSSAPGAIFVSGVHLDAARYGVLLLQRTA